MIPTILKPSIWAMYHHCRVAFAKPTLLVRDMFLSIFSVALVWSIFYGTLMMLRKVRDGIDIAYLSPSLILGLVLLFLFVMLIFSNAVAALGSLFQAVDLERLLASPISPWRFFSGKLLEIIFQSSWMAVIFGVPVVLAFGKFYEVGWPYYLTAIIVAPPYFLIPAATAMLGTILLASVLPINRTREILIAICILMFVALYLIVRLVLPSQGALANMNDVLQLVAVFSLPNTMWVPSYWVGQILGERLDPTGKPLWPFALALYSTAITISGAAFLCVRLLHFRAFSRARTQAHGLRLMSRRSQARLRMVTPGISLPYRALIGKELRLFSRDMAQALQLLLLLGLCMIYLYNFRILRTVSELPSHAGVGWWEGLLIFSNLCMGAFVITAVGTRFVFPSISLEGQAMWMLVSSPFQFRDMLRAKFWFWWIPVSCMASVILASGALAINASPSVVALNAVASWIICFGIVGLGVGLGAYFSNFSWEHPSQLAASFGSLVYMLLSIFLIVMNMIPIALLTFLRALRSQGYDFSTFEWYVAIGSTTALLLYINYATARWALNLGEQALKEKFS